MAPSKSLLALGTTKLRRTFFTCWLAMVSTLSSAQQCKRIRSLPLKFAAALVRGHREPSEALGCILSLPGCNPLAGMKLEPFIRDILIFRSTSNGRIHSVLRKEKKKNITFVKLGDGSCSINSLPFPAEIPKLLATLPMSKLGLHVQENCFRRQTRTVVRSWSVLLYQMPDMTV